MHPSTILSALTLAAAAVNAVPNADTANDYMVEKEPLMPRQQATISLWRNYCYGGPNPYHHSGSAGPCRNLPPNFRNVASSGRARNGYQCWIYDRDNCQGASYRFTDDPKFCTFNNRANSWRCTAHV